MIYNPLYLTQPRREQWPAPWYAKRAVSDNSFAWPGLAWPGLASDRSPSPPSLYYTRLPTLEVRPPIPIYHPLEYAMETGNAGHIFFPPRRKCADRMDRCEFTDPRFDELKDKTLIFRGEGGGQFYYIYVRYVKSDLRYKWISNGFFFFSYSRIKHRIRISFAALDRDIVSSHPVKDISRDISILVYIHKFKRLIERR